MTGLHVHGPDAGSSCIGCNRLAKAMPAAPAPAAPQAQAREFRVRWSIGSMSGPWMIPLFASERGKRGGRGPTTQVPCFDEAMFVEKPLLDPEGKPVTRKSYNSLDGTHDVPIMSAPGSKLDEKQLKLQGRAMVQLEKRLKADGFVLDHTDDEGFQVYRETGKGRGRR